MLGKLTAKQRVKITREANTVERAHTVPHVTSYNVGYHKANMLDMLLILYPDAPMAVVKWIVAHDTPERFTGDIPSPAKWTGAVDRDALIKVEEEINACIYGEECRVDPQWALICTGLDLLELYLWALDQIMLGNRNLNTMRQRIERYVMRENPFPEAINELYHAARNDWNMMPDLGEYHA